VTSRHGWSPTLIRDAVVSLAEEVFDAVEAVRQDALEAQRRVVERGGRLSSDDISALRHGIRSRLCDRTGPVIGLGLIVAPGLLRDESLRLEWWQLGSDDADPVPLEVDLNRLSLGFYDYESAEWFAVPRRTRSRHVVGPYVDVHGTGLYVLTFTMPVEYDGQFLGVAGADVPSSWFEGRLLRELGAERQVVILNSDGRVVLSTSPRWLAGDLLSSPAEDAQMGFQRLPDLPWRLGIAKP